MALGLAFAVDCPIKQEVKKRVSSSKKRMMDKKRVSSPVDGNITKAELGNATNVQDRSLVFAFSADIIVYKRPNVCPQVTVPTSHVYLPFVAEL